MNDTAGKITFTVLLVNGEKIVHTYDVPSNFDEAMKFIEFWIERIAVALTRGKATSLSFPNPYICYNPDNVLGIQTLVMNAEELEEVIGNTQKKTMGFVKD